MDDLEGKINSILSDPESLEQIMNIAKMLGAGSGSNAQNDSSPAGEAETAVPLEAAPKAAAQDPPSQIPDISGLGIDSDIMMNIVGALNGKSSGNSTALISAIKPYLKSERREKLEKAAKLAKLANVARTAIGSLNL